MTPTQLTNVNGENYTKLIPSSAESLYPSSTKKSEAVKYMNKGLKQLGVSKFSFKILADDTDSGKKTAELLQSNIEATFGSKVSVSVQNLPFKTRLSRSTAGNFDIVVSGWSADFADPISFLDLLTKSNAYNYGKWESTAYNKKVSLSKTTGSTATCWKAMVAAERALLEDQGVMVTPLYYTNETPPASRALNSGYFSLLVNLELSKAWKSSIMKKKIRC